MFVSCTVGHAEFRGRTAIDQLRSLPDKGRQATLLDQMIYLLFNHLE
jgi:hypothetical protein